MFGSKLCIPPKKKRPTVLPTYEETLHARKEKESTHAQLNKILQEKKHLSIQMEHWERLKKITKDSRELEDIDRKLTQLRMDFLTFGHVYF